MFKFKNPFIKSSPLYKHDQRFTEKVIEALKSKPECFSASWFDGESLDTYVRHENKKIWIMIETGQIVKPINPKMTKQQKKVVKRLVAPIVEKDSNYILENIFDNCH